MTRVMFDTNILISAILSAAGNPSKAVVLADELGFEICICKEIRHEVIEKFEEKWPYLLEAGVMFLDSADFVDVPTPIVIDVNEEGLRDKDDRPIFRAAKAAKVDYLVTGDKDLLDFKQYDISIITVTDFIKTVQALR